MALLRSDILNLTLMKKAIEQLEQTSFIEAREAIQYFRAHGFKANEWEMEVYRILSERFKVKFSF